MSTEKLTGSQIRSRFLKFFEAHQHRVVKSSSLVPHNDPTLLFTNAGMVQFKDLFTGKERRDYTRAVSSQKCVRAGGKHNDLENVGVTARHHTFFEMLGNFSFGDYFKKDAVALAWAFITQELKLDQSKLIVTVFKGEQGVPADDEAAGLWAKEGVSPERIVRMGMKDNFWSMGDTGPCGPCSEIHYYQGEGAGTIASFHENNQRDGDDWLEIWNLVFMQFERFADGRLEALPKPSIDTGAGLERVTAVVNGFKSNYDTDLLQPMIQKAAAMCKKTYKASEAPDDVSLRVLADHARATAFLIADGVFPSNEGRGYVLRRIMRRAIRHGERLGFGDLFFHEVVAQVIETFGEHYTELQESRVSIERWVKNEEEGFRRTLRTGLKLLAQRVDKLKAAGVTQLGGAEAFELYDTYGFPVDLTEVILREQGLSVDHDGFLQALQKQRARAGAFKNEDKGIADIYKAIALDTGPVRFVGYELKEVLDGAHRIMAPLKTLAEFVEKTVDGQRLGFVRATVKALVKDGRRVDSASGECDVVIDPTPYYGESGGQIGDKHGELADENGAHLASVRDSQKPVDGFTVTRVSANQVLKVGDTVLARYDATLRHETRAHHSATHLLHKALRDTLGDHVKQAGSLVMADRLRFDFSHFEALKPEQLDAIEAHINQRIQQQAKIDTEVLSFDEAKKKGAIALFGEKYGDNVRVLTIADSVELCGGTHAFSTADIQTLRVTKEEAIAAGVRRLEAVVSQAAQTLDNERHEVVVRLAALLSGHVAPQPELAQSDDERAVAQLIQKTSQAQTQLGEKVAPATDSAAVSKALANVAFGDQRQVLRLIAALRSVKAPQRADIVVRAGVLAEQPIVRALSSALQTWERLDKKLQEGRSAQVGLLAQTLVQQARDVKGTKLVAHMLEDVAAKDLRDYADRIRMALGSGVVALGVVQDDKASLVVAVSKDLIERVKAGDIVKRLAPQIGGSGGGKPDFAQAGGPTVDALPQVLSSVESLVESLL